MYAPLKLGAFTAKRTQVVLVDTDSEDRVEKTVQDFGDRVWAVLDECDALLAEHLPGKRPCTRSASDGIKAEEDPLFARLGTDDDGAVAHDHGVRFADPHR